MTDWNAKDMTRAVRGPRHSARACHYDPCDSPDCPCYVEALADVVAPADTVTAGWIA